MGAVLAAHPRIVIASDEMYEHIYWAAEPFTSFVEANPSLYDRTVTINGCSKAYAMTGWRIGYCGAPKELASAMATIQGQSTSNPSSISQRAATVALNGDQTAVTRDEQGVQGTPRLRGCRSQCDSRYLLPQRGWYFLRVCRCHGAMRTRLKDDNAFAEYLLVEAGVAVVPGSGFGAPGHMRISFATSMNLLEDALRRIGRALASPAARRAG